MFGTVTMSLAERGAYITLLAYQWDVGSVPGDYDILSRVLGCPRAQAVKVWLAIVHKFQQGPDGGWRNVRLETERAKQAAFRQLQSERGKASAANRKTTEPQPEGNRLQTGKQPSLNQGPLQPEVNSSLPSSFPYVDPSDLRRRGRQPPMDMQLKRLKFWRWMAEAFIAKLGQYAEEFDLDAWVHDCDDRETRVIAGDWWDYWLPAFEAEVRRRGLPVVVAETAPTAGKLTTRMAALVRGAREG